MVAAAVAAVVAVLVSARSTYVLLYELYPAGVTLTRTRSVGPGSRFILVVCV
jgi:hypothetical protein